VGLTDHLYVDYTWPIRRKPDLPIVAEKRSTSLVTDEQFQARLPFGRQVVANADANPNKPVVLALLSQSRELFHG
jgi:hypothetical protein